MKKIIISLLSVFVLLLVLTGCSSKKVGNKTVYSTKINRIYENSYHDWYVAGTTKAPDGAKILAANANRNSMYYGEQGGESPALAKYATVEDGKFSVLVNPLGVVDINVYKKAGRKANISIFAITNYHKPWTNPAIPKKFIKAAKDVTNHTVNLKITHSQAKYFNNLN